MNVAPKIVSGLVVKTSKFSEEFSIENLIEAPWLLPIQLNQVQLRHQSTSAGTGCHVYSLDLSFLLPVIRRNG